MRILCFTTSLNRYKMVRGTIFEMIGQSIPVHHGVNIATTDPLATHIFDDIPRDRTTIVFNPNLHQHDNHINAIKCVKDYMDYDYFIKIDDDDIYKIDYVKNTIEALKSYDVVSSRIETQLNGSKIIKGNWSNLGGNPENKKYHMPMTLAFNRKALEVILKIQDRSHWEDMLWRRAWVHLKEGESNNSKNVIWHIHGANISTSQFLIK